MEELALLLARFHFAFSTAVHIMFPAFTIGLGMWLAVLNTQYWLSGKQIYLDLFNRWKNIFVIAFGLGVISGVPLSLLLGGQWSEWAFKTSPTLGPLIGYEVLTAFFLEAGFLGVAIFGRDRVGPVLHLVSTWLVAIGTTGSAFWILSANSWMQTPTGFEINELGQFIPVDWMAVIFNPSFGYRFAHMILGAFLTTSAFVLAAGAYHIMRNKSVEQARVMLRHAVVVMAILAPVQAYVGDLHGLNTLEHQPAKVAAMEGIYEDTKAAGWHVVGIPNSETGTVDYAVTIPYLTSWILTHDPNGEVKGLNSFEEGADIPVGTVFWSFRIMIAMGVGMIMLGAWGAWKLFRGTIWNAGFFHKAAIWMAPSGIIAVIAGWTVTEVGRQPYTVYGYLTTSDSFSNLSAHDVMTSLAAFGVAYMIAMGTGIYWMLRKAKEA